MKFYPSVSFNGWLYQCCVVILGFSMLTANAMDKEKVLVVLPDDSEIALQQEKVYSTGFFLNELAIPVQALIREGFEPVYATPNGGAAVWDKHSLSKDFFGGSEKSLEAAVQFLQQQESIQKPLSFSKVLGQGVDKYAGVFIPGGHAVLGNLSRSIELGKILRQFHLLNRPTAMICHGPVALLSALLDGQGVVPADKSRREEAIKDWPYTGYRMTVFSTAEERYAEKNQLGGAVLAYPAEILADAGAIVEVAGMWKSHAVRDRELITGQQPFSDEAFTQLFLAALKESRKN